MHGLKKLMIASGFAFAALGGGAQAADMTQPFLEPILPVEVASSWYLRGDIGYKMYTTPNAAYSSLVQGYYDYYNIDLDNSWTIGGGVGYQFNPWFRADLTVDYSAQASYSSRLTCFIACNGALYTEDAGKISTWAILANAYVDLGTWAGITPYVGGGIGAANVRLSDYSGYYALPPFNPVATVAANSSQWNFAWAVTAGASIDMTDVLLLDLNYRYLAVGDVSTADQYGGKIEVNDIASHEFRVGLRYMIN